MKKQLESTMDQDAGAGLSSNTNTWGEGGNTFNGQEVGILQMIQSAEDPILSARKASMSAAGAFGAEEKSSTEAQQDETDINLLLTRAPDWGENTPVSPGKASLPRPPKLLKQLSPTKSPRSPRVAANR